MAPPPQAYPPLVHNPPLPSRYPTGPPARGRCRSCRPWWAPPPAPPSLPARVSLPSPCSPLEQAQHAPARCAREGWGRGLWLSLFSSTRRGVGLHRQSIFQRAPPFGLDIAAARVSTHAGRHKCKGRFHVARKQVAPPTTRCLAHTKPHDRTGRVGYDAKRTESLNPHPVPPDQSRHDAGGQVAQNEIARGPCGPPGWTWP